MRPPTMISPIYTVILPTIWLSINWFSSYYMSVTILEPGNTEVNVPASISKEHARKQEKCGKVSKLPL